MRPAHRGLSVISLLTLILSVYTSTASIAYSSSHEPDILASPLPGNIIVDGILDEDAWGEVKAVDVDLSPSNPYGGHVENVKVKAFSNGSWVFVAAEWRDPTEDRWEMPRIRLSPGQYLYNETYHYSDQFIVGWWSEEGSPTEKPWAHTQYAGSTRGKVPWKNGTANLWTWRGYQSDEDSPFWPKPYFDPRAYRWGPRAGEPLIYPHPHAYETILNSTANFVMGTGITHVTACAFGEKETYAFDVWARGRWRDGGWVLEMGRPFTPHSLNQGLTMDFKEDKTYSIFFTVYDGYNGEIEDTGSISEWKTIYMAPRPGGVFSETTLLITISVIIVVIVGATLYRRSRRTPQQ